MTNLLLMLKIYNTSSIPCVVKLHFSISDHSDWKFFFFIKDIFSQNQLFPIYRNETSWSFPIHPNTGNKTPLRLLIPAIPFPFILMLTVLAIKTAPHHFAGKYSSLVNMDTMQGICFLPLNPGRLEDDSKLIATRRLTRVMICMSSSSELWFCSISQSDCMNQEPQDVFLHE